MASAEWTALCDSCDYKGNSETDVGVTTLAECQALCQSDQDCTAIDFGLNSRAGECFLNYGGDGTTTNVNSDFQAYTTKDVKSDEAAEAKAVADAEAKAKAETEKRAKDEAAAKAKATKKAAEDKKKKEQQQVQASQSTDSIREAFSELAIREKKAAKKGIVYGQTFQEASMGHIELTITIIALVMIVMVYGLVFLCLGRNAMKEE